MGIATLAQRYIENTIRAVKRVHELSKEDELYQIWQPTQLAWVEAIQRMSSRKSFNQHCITEYLEFPRDYEIASILNARCLLEVAWYIDFTDEAESRKQCIPSQNIIDSGKTGDVIIDGLGVAHYVLNNGLTEVINGALK